MELGQATLAAKQITIGAQQSITDRHHVIINGEESTREKMERRAATIMGIAKIGTNNHKIETFENHAVGQQWLTNQNQNQLSEPCKT